MRFGTRKKQRMIYSNQDVRRQDRLLSEESAILLLKNGEIGVLSMQAENGGAYAVPVSYVWDGKGSVYFHCAKDGRKLRCIALCNSVSFCVVGRTNVIPDKFTTEYESIILECKAYTNLPSEERMKALEQILDKYSPADKTAGRKYAENSFNKTEIVRLDIEHWSGKRKTVG
jgi:nitroimidazol reductase NimA-like FMN-containing flavoprotein (pyridoxamine 5'-phosphate oxidase superfamily)